MTSMPKDAILHEGFERLEELLRDQRTLYLELDALVARQRLAVQQADVKGLMAAGARERELVEAIRSIDQRRVELAQAIGAEVGVKSEQPLSLSDLLEYSGPRRSALVAIADELRKLVVAVKAASGVVRVATESLSRHMQGIVQTVEAGFNNAGVYERAGRIANGSPWQTAIDIRS
jgi:hypothetical protein